MIIKILTEDEQSLYYDSFLSMLNAADDEFVPPLSARSSTVQNNLSSFESKDDGVLNYFEELKKQRFMIAYEGGEVLAFVSFKENFINNIITEEELPNIYISTLIVKPSGRGKGLTKTMYKILFDEYNFANVFTRTWSTNNAHIKILSAFCFNTIKTLKDDRGAGVDTLYFKKEHI